MEYFDVVDQNRLSLNYQKARGATLTEEEYNVGVEVWIINDNKILMTQRSKNKSHPDKWEVPGGCCQSKETAIDTVHRELQEEIGINLEDKDLYLIGTQLYKKQFVDIFKSYQTVDLKKTTLQDEEVQNIEFVDKIKFQQMIENNTIVLQVSILYLIIILCSSCSDYSI